MSSEQQKSSDIRCIRCGHVNPSWRSQCGRCGAKLTKQTDAAVPTYVKCGSCNFNNPSWRSACANCKAKLIPAKIPDQEYESYIRPGCVSAYAVFLGVAGGFAALKSIISALRAGSGAIGIFLLCAAFAALYVLFARGLWQMRNWARITVIVMQTLGFALNLVTLLLPIGRALYVIGSILGLILNGYIIYWFSTHGELFR